MDTRLEIIGWLKKSIIPFYMMGNMASMHFLNERTLKVWKEDMAAALDGIAVDKLNKAFKAWRDGPCGEYPPVASDLIRLVK